MKRFKGIIRNTDHRFLRLKDLQLHHRHSVLLLPRRYIYLRVQWHKSIYIDIHCYICTATYSKIYHQYIHWNMSLYTKLGPLTGLEIASFFLLRMNFHLLLLQVFLAFPSKYFSPSPPSISLLHVNWWLLPIILQSIRVVLANKY